MATTEEMIDFENERMLDIGSKRRPVRFVPLNATVTNTLREMIEDKQLPLPVKDFRKRWQKALINAA